MPGPWQRGKGASTRTHQGAHTGPNQRPWRCHGLRALERSSGATSNTRPLATRLPLPRRTTPPRESGPALTTGLIRNTGQSTWRTVMPLCAERGLGYTPHSPLCGGILSGKYRPGEGVPADSRVAVRAGPYQEYMSDRNLEGVQRFASEADRRGVSPSGLALAWVMSRVNVAAPVVGPRRLEHFTAVREALELRLDVDEQERLASLISA
jgi:Aldo/keto reductase family